MPLLKETGGDMSTMSLWAADPHEYGAGKIHIVDDDQAERTMCGRWLASVPGKLTKSGRATCKSCLNAVENRAHRKLQEEEYRRESERRLAERQSESREWWEKYDTYLRSDSWRRKRERVLKRANRMCEACLERPASEVHHLTYAHLFNEPCYELRAMCGPCHDTITDLDRARRNQS